MKETIIKRQERDDFKQKKNNTQKYKIKTYSRLKDQK